MKGIEIETEEKWTMKEIIGTIIEIEILILIKIEDMDIEIKIIIIWVIKIKIIKECIIKKEMIIEMWDIKMIIKPEKDIEIITIIIIEI